MFPPTHLHLSVFLKSGDNGTSKDIFVFRAGESLTHPALQLGTHCPAWDLASFFGLAVRVGSAFRQLVHNAYYHPYKINLSLMRDLWP